MASSPIAIRFFPGCRGHISAGELRRIASSVLQTEGVVRNAGVEVVLADAATVQDLNRLYRGQNEPTDVLSFAANEGEPFIEAPEAPPMLGEVVVCLPIAISAAATSGHALEGEVAHLVVHGLLHILGWDHEEEGDGEAMKLREDEILGGLGYAGGYAHGH